MPTTATCTGGTVVHMRPLPSLVTVTMVPVSATRKLPPEMPISAARNSSRSFMRAIWVSCLRLGGRVHAQLLPEQGGDVFLGQVERRDDDVRRPHALQLDDVFAEVGLQRPNAGGLQRMVQADLLGHHALGL